MTHPAAGWSYPNAERVVDMDHGAQISAIVIEDDGTAYAMCWRLADIMVAAISKQRINVLPPDQRDFPRVG